MGHRRFIDSYLGFYPSEDRLLFFHATRGRLPCADAMDTVGNAVQHDWWRSNQHPVNGVGIHLGGVLVGNEDILGLAAFVERAVA